MLILSVGCTFSERLHAYQLLMMYEGVSISDTMLFVKVILLVATTVNGKIAHDHHEVAMWTSKEDKKFFVSETKKWGALIMGRTTYETIGKPLPGRLNIVMTRTPDVSKNIPNSLEFTADVPDVIIKNLESRGLQGVVVAGGASVYSQFLEK